MNRGTHMFLVGALLGSIATFAVRNGAVNAQSVQSWSKSEVTPILFVKPSFGTFVPSDESTIGISWSKDQVLPICLVRPSLGGFDPVDGMSVGNTWTKGNVKPVVFVEPYLGTFIARADGQTSGPSAAVRSTDPTGVTGARPTSCNPAVETHIDGDFNGWDDEVIYKMDDGSIWQQSNYHYHYHYTYHPSVTIYPTRSGVCHIKVEGDDDEGADVNRIK
jgi:hypothetical protein